MGRKAAFAGFILGLTVFGCGARTGLLELDGVPLEAGTDDVSTTPTREERTPLDAALEDRVPAPDAAIADEPPVSTTPGCVPAPETCNGIDDDCNGQIDDGLAATPCPGGGSRYCVAGRLSECPRRCEACIPGSERVCFLSYCRYWGLQTCAADGRSFGRCREAAPPSSCSAIAEDQHNSAALEQCCVDKGYCCVDTFDLNQNGDRGELLGRCDEVLCGP